MLRNKLNNTLNFNHKLIHIITLMFLFALVATPIIGLIQVQPASAQPATVLTPKWTRSNMGTNWEGGLVLGDVTGDGIEDVVFGGGGNDIIHVLNGVNGATIATYSNSRIGTFCQPQLYDIDNDGVLDILVPLYYEAGLAAVQYDGDSSLSEMWEVYIQGDLAPGGEVGSGSVMAKPVAGDVDGDGDLEIFLASQDVSPEGGYDGTIVKIDHEGNILAQSSSWRACSGGLSLADADNDGVFEVYQGDRDMGYYDGGYGKGAKSFWADNMTERWIRLDYLTSSQAPLLIDYDGDGILEVIAGMYGSRDGLAIYNSTNGQWIRKLSNSDLSIHYGLTVYDIDGDGHLELLCNDGDHDNEPYTDIFDLVTGQMDAQLYHFGQVLCDDPNYLDGAEYNNLLGTSKWSPLVANIWPDNKNADGTPIMEIISVPEGTGLDGGRWWHGAILIWAYDPVTQVYESLQNITRAPGATPGTYSTSRLGSQLAYPTVQDIDGDGLLEFVTHASSGAIYAFDTTAPAPGYNEEELSGSKRIRSEVTFFGERRVGVAEHTIAPWEEDYWTAPLVAPVSPGHNSLAVPVGISQLSFKVRDHQSNPLTYSVTTSPNIGSRNGLISSGTYDWNTITVPVSGLAYDTTYRAIVTVSDGTGNVTTRTYTFRTELATRSNTAPNQGPPALTSLDGLDKTTSTFQCANQTTTDANGDKVTNIYRWTVNDEPVAQLLMPFDMRDETSTADYSGFGNNGVVKGAAWVPNGIMGGAYSFDGEDDAIVISDGGAGYFNGRNYPDNNEELGGFGNWDGVTVETWFYPTEINNGSRLVAKIPSYAIGFASGEGFRSGGNFYNSRLYGSVWPYTGEVADDDNKATVDSMTSVSAYINITLNTWYHLAFTYQDGVGMRLYLNGSLIAQSSSSGGPLSPSRGEPLYIGRLVQPFAGMIDEVRLYNYAQSGEQILNRYMESKDGNSSSSLLIPFGIAGSGDEIGCEIIPTDSYAQGPIRSNSLIIQNSPPNASDLTLYPVRDRAYRLDSENLVANYTYYDADNDIESGTQIRWYRSGVLQPSFNNQIAVPAGSTSIGQTWYFTVQPMDGANFGDVQTSETITIRGNLAPNTGTPTLDSMNGGTDYDDEDLVGTAATTTDADGDSTTNIYRWTKNGVSLTNLQMPFDTEIPRLSGSNGIATDYSGYGNNGSVNGSTWIQGGVIGGALSFDGNDYITVAENADSLGSDGSWSEISLEYWVKAGSVSSSYTQQVLSMHDNDYSTGGWQGDPYGIAYSSDFRAYSNRDRFYWTVYNDTGSASVQYNEYSTFGQWHHVVCTYESGVGLKLYVDGLERATAALTGNINGTNDGLTFIGGTGSGGFVGSLDEVRIYPNALSSEQVFQRYLDTKDGVSDSETIVPQETTAGNTWICQVIPNDSWQDGTARTSTTLNVVTGDGRPRIDWFSPANSTMSIPAGTILDFLQVSSDPNGQALSYSWTLDGTTQATTQNWTSPVFTSAGLYVVRVTASDGSLTDSQEWQITVEGEIETRNLVILAASNGNTNPAPGTHLYNVGANAQVDAIPNAGYKLSHWLRNGTNIGSTDPCTITMDENYELQPVFAVDDTPYTLTITTVGDGSVTKTPDQASYTYGTDVTLTADPADGYEFTGWSGDASGTALTTVVKITGNMEVTATFELSALFRDGFESGDFSQWSVPTPTEGETATVVSSQRHHGTYGARFTTDGDGGTERAYIYKTLNPQTELYVRGYFNIAEGLPLEAASNRFNLFSFVSGGTPLASMGVIRTTAGADRWYIQTNVGIWNATTGPEEDRWYCVEFYIKVDSTNGVLTSWVDGNMVWNQSGINTAYAASSVNTVRCELVFVNGISHPLDVYSDCLAISNNYIGPEEDGDGVTLQISVTGQGTTDPAPGTYQYSIGTPITVDALAGSGYKFDHWLLNGENVGTTDPYSFTLTANSVLTAVFTPTSTQSTMEVSVDTDRERYTKWSYVEITVTATDETSGAPLQNANVALTVYDTHGRVAWTSTGTTGSDGIARFTYKLVFNAQMGTYTINAITSLSGYTNGNGQTSFYCLG